MHTKHLKYLPLPFFVAHGLTYFSVTSPLWVFALVALVAFIPLGIAIFLQDKDKQRYEASLPLNKQNHTRFRARYFFVGLFLAFYTVTSMMVMMGSEVAIKAKRGKYFAMDDNTRFYYEITEQEYHRRKLIAVRGFTSLPLLFSYLGYVFVRLERD